MKNTTKVFLLAGSSLAFASLGHAVTLTSFGNVDTPTFVVLGGSGFTPTQGASSLQIVGNDGETLSGDFGSAVDASIDVGAATDLYLSGSIVSAPATTFTIRLFDGEFDSIDYIGGSWVDVSSDGFSVLSLSGANAAFDATNIIGLDLITNGLGSNAIDATLTDLTFGGAVPEPSTYATLAGLCALGYVMVRRRK